MNRLVSLRLFALAVLTAFLFSACDSGGSNGDGTVNNEFSLDISPTAKSKAVVASQNPDTTISGYSFFYSGTNPDGEEAFAIYFTGGNSFSPQSVQQGLFGFIGRNEVRSSTGTGTFSFAGPDQGFDSGNFIGILFEDYGTTNQFGTNPYYVPQSGEVTIDKSTSNEVKGSVDFTAYKLQIDTTGATPVVDSTEVDITGSFAAKDVQQFAPLVTP